MGLRILLSLAMVFFCSPLAGDAPPKGGAGSFVSDEVIVGFRKGTGDSERAAALNRTPGFRLLKRFKSRGVPGSPLERIYLLQLPPGIDVDRAIADLEADPLVEYAHPNHVYHAQGLPNDPQLPVQWGFLNTGAAVQRGPDLPIAGSDAAAAEAHDLIQSLSLTPGPVIVAVIDTGINLTHPDLAGNLWINTDEIAGNGIDDDLNGYVDDRNGYDFANNDGNPADGDGHGSHVAGTIGAVCGNGIGVCGLAPNARLMALKFLDDLGSGTTADAIESVNYAVDNGATVLSAGWSAGSFEQALYDAIEFGLEAGVLFVAPAGNFHVNSDAEPAYPAAYDLPNVVSVGASSPWRGMAAEFSNWGLTSVDLAAPGEEIISTVVGTTYQYFDGTSMATASVSAALALVYGLGDELWPALWGTWSPAQKVQAMRDRLLARSERWPALDGLTVTGGHLNMANLLSPDVVPPAGPALTAHTGDAFHARLRVNATGDNGNTGTANYYDLRYQTGAALNFATATPVPGLWTPRSAGGQDTLVVSDLTPGTQYTFGLKVIDKAGNPSAISQLLTVSTPEGSVAFTDDMEGGAGSWTNSGTGMLWALSTAAAHSPTHAWNDSPGGNYPNNREAILNSPEIQTAGQQTTVTFWHRYDIEKDFDLGHVEVRRFQDGVWGEWLNQLTVTGTRSDWHRILFTIPASDAVQVRFRLVSNASIGADGWTIDDLDMVTAPGPTTVILDDNFVNSTRWVLSGTWGIEANALSDSPGLNYPLNNRSSARLLNPLNLSTAGAVEVSFQLSSFNYENNWDFLYFQYSLDAVNWRTLSTFTGTPETGTRTLNLDVLGGQPQVYFRFLSSTDSDVAMQGARIDNFLVRVASAAGLCPFPCEIILKNGFENP